MIDLHAHILPDVDDGPENMTQSVEMARAMIEVGIDTVTTSSHHYAAMGWHNGPEQIRAALGALRQELKNQDIALNLVPSSEHFYDAELLDRVRQGKVQPINDKRYILLEFSPSVLPPNMPEVLYQIRRLGLEALVAHVERYPALASRLDHVQTLVDQGYLLQVDAGALTGHFGREQKKLAWRLLDADLVHVVASDAHRAADLLKFVPKACKLITKRLGQDRLRRLWTSNPQKIIDGKSLDDTA